MKLYLNDMEMLCAVGNSREEILNRLQNGDRSGLILSDEFSQNPVYLGKVKVDLPVIEKKYSVYDCKNNRLLLAALSRIKGTLTTMINQFGTNRIGIVLGTSTSGVRNTELALQAVANHQQKPELFHYKQQQLAGGADFLAHMLGIKGPAFAISTACSSSGKAFASARRLIQLDICDAVVVGGADSLCKFTVQGFSALESVSTGLCKPFGQHRDGINLAEAVSLFILSKQESKVELQGIGASSDAFHFSAPDPKGDAVIDAMKKALANASKTATEIDYINMHGTATPLNDAMESKAINQVFGDNVAVSSTKGMTGHALGAAAALEVGICWMLINENQRLLIPNINDATLDQTLPQLNYVSPRQKLAQRIETCQSNSFAFGGNNISIIVGRA